MHRTSSPIRRLPPRRMAAPLCAFLALVLGANLLAASPAEAASIDHSLPYTAGHTCFEGQPDGFGNTAVMCIEIGVYTSAATGASSVTAQAEAFCKSPTGALEPCPGMTIYAEVANGAGTAQSRDYSCGPCQQTTRNYFYPFGGLPISSGHPVFNVWGVFLAPSEIDMPDTISATFPPGNPPHNFATPHYNVSMDPGGRVSFSKV